ncbi:hypothetical protein CY34DRAFT_757325, partial [Suillus luteus UH-Slu-Lm8-n1]
MKQGLRKTWCAPNLEIYVMRAIDLMIVENRTQVDILGVAPKESGQSVLGQAFDPFRPRSIVEFGVML